MIGRILIVDDEKDLLFFIRAGLAQAGWQVDEADTSEAALELLAAAAYDVVLLDLRLGRSDGQVLMGQIRQRWPETEIIIMTAYPSLDSAIEAVHQAAFDYLRKPCSIQDIATSAGRALAHKQNLDRQRRLARQSQPRLQDSPRPASADAICSGALVIEPGTHQVWLAGRPVLLTPTEYAILEVLARSLGQAVPLEQLIEQSLGRQADGFNDQETLRVHISNLRRKLSRRYILTVRGGYSLVDLPPVF